ncbi:MAG: hypothetical protein KGJ13_10635 [Patescibacteria group bacterium]|nr:hypothetical protein [Patescibacteria group bacterium]
MKQIDLREVNKLVSRYRHLTTVLKRVRHGDKVLAVFDGRYYQPIKLADTLAFSGQITALAEKELNQVRARLNDIGIDPVEAAKDGRSKKKVKAA